MGEAAGNMDPAPGVCRLAGRFAGGAAAVGPPADGRRGAGRRRTAAGRRAGRGGRRRPGDDRRPAAGRGGRGGRRAACARRRWKRFVATSPTGSGTGRRRSPRRWPPTCRSSRATTSSGRSCCCAIRTGQARPHPEAADFLHLAAVACLTEVAVEEAKEEVEQNLRGSFLEDLRSRPDLDPRRSCGARRAWAATWRGAPSCSAPS